MDLDVKALLFDMDGVLIDSADAWLTALNSALTCKHYPPLSKQEFISKYWGHDLKDTLQLMNIPLSILDDCTIRYQQFVQQTQTFPQTIETLRQLDHYPKAIITNTNKILTEKILRTLKLSSFFKVITTGDMVDHAKPNPALVLKACELLEIPANQTVLIGDTKSDVIAGRKAGCTVVGININADYTISDISALPVLLEKHKSNTDYTR